MKILSAEQIRAADAYTIQSQNLRSEELMERAGITIFNWLHQQLNGSPVTLHIFCGIGNNGGDGLVVARHLLEHGYKIQVYVVNYSDKRSQDFLINFDRLKEQKVWPEILKEKSPMPDIQDGDIVVDAIFGTGLNREPSPWVGRLMQDLNSGKNLLVSIDIPSGMFLDKPSDLGRVIHANYVLTFQHPKLVFFLPSTGSFCEQWVALDIGLDEAFINSLDTDYELIGYHEIRPLYRFRSKFSHKGTFGHAVIAGGSHGKIGAIKLAAEACLRSGSGLVTAYVPGCGLNPLQSSIPEVMVLTDGEEKEIREIKIPFQPTVVGIGMGMGTSKPSLAAFRSFLEGWSSPVVVDADGLNMLAKEKAMLKLLPPLSVLTPHPGELERLIGSWKNEFEKLEMAREFVKKVGCILVIKGAHTIVLDKEKGYVNTSGNPGMATAGSGDVLTGVITGLLAQGYTPLEAALMGVYVHGRAGDLCLQAQSMESLTAGDIIIQLGTAFREFYLEDSTQSNEEEGE
ncbi:NAD(P)H-hydrate dehydratase [Muriicola marianensis]|uniref:Bifunctional NAD(P)H-hydrate repair enzyme n=1 Tax=Muriicola marianensis TaxID=1324801 RepID=A0ABQ1QT85_9FLAO|nr:NAD(P)H-hydrate dehydratase [Muriicola marianensis]GGD41781.1 bifunctional NAD(P)H-hydrate repair enzyme [Muriicola marianensis]